MSEGSIHKNSNISLLSATLLSSTCMIGSGWLFSAQLTAQIAGNWAFIAWILTAVLVLCIGLCLAKVVSIYPVRGATARLSALSHNSIFGMPFAFANWFGIMVVIATEAQATTQYLSAAIGSEFLIQNNILTLSGKFLALSILFIYLMVNFYGVKLLIRINNIVTIFKIFIPLFVITIFLIISFYSNPDSNYMNNFSLTTNSNYNFHSAILAIIGSGLIYSFNGFQVSVSFASEIKNPKRNIPLSMIFSVLIILLVYMGLQYAFMKVIPHNFLILHGGWKGIDFASPLLNLSMILGLNFLALLLLVDSIVSPSGTGYTYLGASSRMLYAMSTEGQMPRWIAKLDPIYNFSKRSMIINWILAAIVLFNAESWAALMVVVTVYHVIGYMAAPISMGAVVPKLRWVGMIVFILLGIIILTIPSHNLLIVNVSLTVLLIIYAFIQMKVGLKKLFLFISPFLTYLWILYFIPNIIVIMIISSITYIFITNKSYIQLCKD